MLKSFVRRRWVRIVLVAAAVLAGSIFIASFSLVRYIEGHSEEWTGRRITLSSVWFNPFNCSLTLRNVSVYERQSSAVFLSFRELYLNASPWSYWLDDEIRFSKIVLSDPFVYLQMNRDASFNYGDLVERFAGNEHEPDTGKSSPVRYVVEQVQMQGGALRFVQETFQAGVDLKQIELGTSTIAWNQPEVNYDVHMEVASGGRLASKGSFHRDSLSYRMGINADSLALNFLLPFADKVLYVADVRGNIDTDLYVTGTARIPVMSVQGLFSLNDFNLMDTLRKPVASIEQLALDFGDVKPVDGIYNIELARLSKPYLKFDITPGGNNLLRLTSVPVDSTGGAPSDTIQIQESSADPYLSFFRLINQYLIEWGREYAINHYSIDSLALTQGSLELSDYTLKQPFHFLMEDLNVGAYEITNAADSILVTMNSVVNHSGKFDAGLHLSTKNLGDMSVHYGIDSLKIVDFSPYSEHYVAHPFWDGVVSFESSTSVSNHYLKSSNRLFIANLEVGDRVESVTALKLPLKLAVSLLKDVNGNVDLSIPLKGDVNDPKFRVMPVVWQILKNLVVKAAASPYKLVARAVDAKEDDVRDIKYDYLQSDIRKRQNKTVALLARILTQKKSLSVTFVHFSNTDWEAVQYALYKARLDYYAASKGRSVLNLDDSLAADGVSASDSSFIRFVEEKSGKTLASSDIEALTIELAGGKTVIAQALADAAIARKQQLSDALLKRGISADRFTISDAPAALSMRHRERPKFDIRFNGDGDSEGPPRRTGSK